MCSIIGTYNVSSDMKHYNITLLRTFQKFNCHNVTLMLNILESDDKIYEKSEVFCITLLEKKDKLMLGLNYSAMVTIQDDDVVEVYLETNRTLYVLEGDEHIQLTLMFNTTIQEWVTPVEISIVHSSAKRKFCQIFSPIYCASLLYMHSKSNRR